jgi:hypothetical protein
MSQLDSLRPELTSENKTGGITPLFTINAAAVLFLTGVALAATLTRGSQLSSLRVWGMSGVAFVVLASLVRTRIHIRQYLASLLGGTAMGVVTIVHLLRGTASSLYPTSGSVDVVHHYALLQYLFYNGQLPTASSDSGLTFLGEMAQYPFGAHVNAAVLAGASNVQPLVALTLFIYLVIALSATLLVELTRQLVREIWPESSEGAATAAGVTAALVFLMVPRLTEGMVMADYFYSQVMGIYLLLFCTVALLDSFSRDSRVALVMSGVASFLIALTYPLFSLIPIATVTLILLIRYRFSWNRWSAILPVTLGAVLGSLLFLPGRVSTGLLIIRNEGLSVTPSISLLGGPLLFGLFAIGLSVAVAALVSKRRVAVGLLLATVLMTTLQMTAMYVAKGALDIGSYYMAEKLWYIIFWLMLPLVGLGMFAVARTLLPKHVVIAPRAGGVLASGVLLVAALWATLWTEEGQATPLINPDTYAVAEWARSEIAGQGQFAMAEGGPQGYMLYVGVLNQPRDAYAMEMVLLQGGDLLQYWTATPEKRFLVTSDVHALENVIEVYGLEIVHQQGTAAVLTRQQ